MDAQLSTEKSSLCRAGNSRCGVERLNFASASMCSMFSSLQIANTLVRIHAKNQNLSYLRSGIFASSVSPTKTSPLSGNRWLRSSSIRRALRTAWLNRLISATPLRPGRSEDTNLKLKLKFHEKSNLYDDQRFSKYFLIWTLCNILTCWKEHVAGVERKFIFCKLEFGHRSS